MNTRTVALAQSLFVLALFAVPSLAQDEESAQEGPDGGDRTSGIAVRPGRRIREQAESDYAVSCQDGNMYRVYLNAAGRVVVEKRK